MAFKDYLEQYTLGEMTFGIEIEGVVYNALDKDELLASFRTLFPSYDLPESSMKDDPSIDGERCEYCDGDGFIPDYEDGEGNSEGRECEACHGTGKLYETFEFTTPVMNVTPKNIAMMINFFDQSFKKQLFRTNESCGMHVHIGLPDDFNSAEDRFWIMCQMANDNYWNGFLQHMEVDGGDFDFVNLQYASNGTMNRIARALKDQGAKALSNVFDSDKYRIMRIHPNYNTLEWRGPRNFLNDRKLSYVKVFFYEKLIPIIKMFTKMQKKDTITWGDGEISRKDFFAMVTTNDTELKYRSSANNRKAKKDNRWHPTQDPKEIGKIIKLYPKILSEAFADANISAYVAKDGKNIIIKKGIFDNISFNSLFEFDGGASFNGCYFEKLKMNIFGQWVTIKSHFYNCEVSSFGNMYQCVFDDCVVKNARLNDCRCDKCTLEDITVDVNTTVTNSKKISNSVRMMGDGKKPIDLR